MQPYLIRHLFDAIYVGDAVSVECLLKRGVSPNSTNEREETALIVAVDRGYERIAELLLAYGADIDARGTYGATALMPAACYGRTEAVRLLLAHGADIHAKTTGDYPCNALYGALANHHEEVALLLKEAGLEEEPGMRELLE